MAFSSSPSVEIWEEDAPEYDISSCEDEKEEGKLDISGVICLFSFKFLHVNRRFLRPIIILVIHTVCTLQVS